MGGRAYPTTIEAGDHRSRRPRRARDRLPRLLRGRRVGLLCHQPRSRATCATRSTWCARCRACASPLSSRPSTASPAPPRIRSHDRRRATTAPTGLPVWSLYGRRLAPTQPRSLRGLDTLVVDLQDVGARYYTYRVDHDARHAGMRARGRAPWWCSTGRTRSAASSLEGNIADPRLRLLRRALPAADAPRHDHRASWPAI